MHLLKTALTYVAIFAVGAVTSVSCFEPEFGNPSFRCSPADKDACPEDQKCCSDDPAATEGRLPNYFMMNTANERYGPPIFSGNNNPLSTSGACVETGGFTSPFPNGCPVPCNPTWDEGTLAEFCGTSKCCQMEELDPTKDCILDPGTNLWRAIDGGDIPELTNWGNVHATNQDPVGANCMIFASGGGTLNQEAFDDCIAQLTVANQRGFCYDPTKCPCIEDVCAMKNPGYAFKCAAAPGTTVPTTAPATM